MTDTLQDFLAEDVSSLSTSELLDKRSWCIESRHSIRAIDAELKARGELETIEVDTVEDPGDVGETLIDWLVKQQLERGLKARVVDVFGPGGGNPIVEWSGPRDALEQLLRQAYDADDADVTMHLG